MHRHRPELGIMHCSGGPRFPCEKCSRSFLTQHLLNQHYRLKHDPRANIHQANVVEGKRRRNKTGDEKNEEDEGEESKIKKRKLMRNTKVAGRLACGTSASDENSKEENDDVYDADDAGDADDDDAGKLILIREIRKECDSEGDGKSEGNKNSSKKPLNEIELNKKLVNKSSRHERTLQHSRNISSPLNASTFIRHSSNLPSDDNMQSKKRQLKRMKSQSKLTNSKQVMTEKPPRDRTPLAHQLEMERLQCIAKRQKVSKEIGDQCRMNEEKVNEFVLDFDETTREKLIEVDKSLVTCLKPHQRDGIKFMWDACFASSQRAKIEIGSGYILAHCMGLGKTLQVVTLAHTLLSNHDKTNVKTVLVVAPLSTVLNWVNEFKMWLEKVDNKIVVFHMTEVKSVEDRRCQLRKWRETGGVMVIGYEMFRSLTNPPSTKRHVKEKCITEPLINPGPDLVVCDEGHLLKNEDTAINKGMNLIKTKRRIVLTGTPLQNNLKEYYSMVNFVKPHLLGDKKEFHNTFGIPIKDGLYEDSSIQDVEQMELQTQKLHTLTESFVQRCDSSVLKSFLPPKQEYVICVKVTDIQCKLYKYYLENLAKPSTNADGSLFNDFHALQRIWTHPYVMKLNADQMRKQQMCSDDSKGLLKDFIDDDSKEETTIESDQEPTENDTDCIILYDLNNDARSKNGKKKNENIEKVEPEGETRPPEKNQLWWEQFVKPEHFDVMNLSAKLVILFQIIEKSEQIGDKVLVFSQSKDTLTLIEKFLAMIHSKTIKRETKGSNVDDYKGKWLIGHDYFRMDGDTPIKKREDLINSFNKTINARARLFLISSRVGGLGINLTAANRAVIFDVNWNPSNDVQSIFRIYRLGQEKPCYIYRLVAAGTMEETMYKRQVTKLSLSCRVVDKQKIERLVRNTDVTNLYKFNQCIHEKKSVLGNPKDRLLTDILSECNDLVLNFYDHDSMLEKIVGEELDAKASKKDLVVFKKPAKKSESRKELDPKASQKDSVVFKRLTKKSKTCGEMQYLNIATEKAKEAMWRRNNP